MRSRAPFRAIARLRQDSSGSTLIEFAVLAPVFLSLMIGVLQIGTYMQNYTAVRSLASDAARFAAVEYQKSNELSTDDLESDIVAMGATTPYNLTAANLAVDVTEVSPSDVDGSRKFNMQITYQVPTFMSGVGFKNITLTYSRPLYVIA